MHHSSCGIAQCAMFASCLHAANAAPAPQEIRLTQQAINEALGAELLGRVVFYGQSDITALLEASVETLLFAGAPGLLLAQLALLCSAGSLHS